MHVLQCSASETALLGESQLNMVNLVLDDDEADIDDGTFMTLLPLLCSQRWRYRCHRRSP
jgi:hypothetical protein